MPLLPQPPAAAVDLGCGTGSLSMLLAEHGLVVSGLDLSPRMLDRARDKVARTGLSVDLHHGDAGDPPFPDASFELAICRHVLWTMVMPAEAVRRWRALLRPGGTLLAIEGAWSSGGGLTGAEAMALVSPHFATAELQRLDDPALWGRAVSDERYVIVART